MGREWERHGSAAGYGGEGAGGPAGPAGTRGKGSGEGERGLGHFCDGTRGLITECADVCASRRVESPSPRFASRSACSRRSFETLRGAFGSRSRFIWPLLELLLRFSVAATGQGGDAAVSGNCRSWCGCCWRFWWNWSRFSVLFCFYLFTYFCFYCSYFVVVAVWFGEVLLQVASVRVDMHCVSVQFRGCSGGLVGIFIEEARQGVDQESAGLLHVREILLAFFWFRCRA